MIDWSYDVWPSGEPYTWEPAERGPNPIDNMDFHVDLGCGTIKKGRIGIDRHAAAGVNIVMDLDKLRVQSLPAHRGLDAPVPVPTNLGVRDIAKHVPTLHFGLPFEDDSIESVISHHCLEHIGDGFVALVDEVYRVLKPGGIFRAITPLFPSRTAVEDPDHRRYFMEGTWETFCGPRPGEGEHWHSSFSVPYTQSRFELLEKDVTPPMPPGDEWGPDDAREIRVALRK